MMLSMALKYPWKLVLDDMYYITGILKVVIFVDFVKFHGEILCCTYLLQGQQSKKLSSLLLCSSVVTH